MGTTHCPSAGAAVCTGTSGAAAVAVVGTTHAGPFAGAAAVVGSCTHIPGVLGTGAVGAADVSVNMLSSTFRRTVGESPGSVSASDIDWPAGVATYVVSTSSGVICSTAGPAGLAMSLDMGVLLGDRWES